MNARFKALPDTKPTLDRDAGRDKLLYIDAPSGVAGDMLLAALIDLGVPLQHILDGIAGLGLTGYRIELQTVERSSIAAKRFVVHVDGEQPLRDHAAIVELLQRATSLTTAARKRALATFALLAAAEARVHGVPMERVHFHEVGAVDSIVDIVGAAIALDYLGARLVSSPLPLGRGYAMTQHGRIPLPAPATVLCLQGVPTYDAGISEELVTPTGAALVATSCESYGLWPHMSTVAAGFGAGTRVLADRPNLLRVVLGAPRPDAGVATRLANAESVVVETNIDDMTGELAAYVLSRLIEAGALDAWAVPILMKKGRPAVTLCALCKRGSEADIASVLLSESTSFGVRTYAVDRIERPRRSVEVNTQYGTIAVKVADGDGLPATASPEYEDCRKAAETHAVPVREVFAAALAAYRARL